MKQSLKLIWEKELKKIKKSMNSLVGINLTAGYGGVDIIKDINVEVNEGEIAVIVGPNGAGKSTAMKALLGMLNLTSGSVEYSKKQIEAFINKISKDLSEIVLINFGAYKQDNLLVNVDEKELLKSFQINVFSNFYLNKMLIPIMIKNNWGRILNMTSISIKEPLSYLALSNTIRSSVATWGKTLANDVARNNITVNNILTGYFKTERIEELNIVKAKKLNVSVDKV